MSLLGDLFERPLLTNWSLRRLMNIVTDPDVTGLVPDHPWSGQFQVIGYREGGFSFLPHGFFRTWQNLDPDFGEFHLGKYAGFGVGSIVQYDSDAQSLRVGRFFSGGSRLYFLLNGQHETRTISPYAFSILGIGMGNAQLPQYGDSIIKNDVWMGDGAMMLGGGVVENGCIIAAQARLSPNFRSEPYGVYGGTPARLLSFRFTDRIREKLLDLAWWDM